MMEEIEGLGFEAKYEPKSDKSDIRVIVEEALKKYKFKFYSSLVLALPIFVLIYIAPFACPSFLTSHIVTNNVPLYVFLNAFFSTLIQIVMGA